MTFVQFSKRYVPEVMVVKRVMSSVLYSDAQDIVIQVLHFPLEHLIVSE